ncbi:hypothetical protein BDR07DRAFT_837741 [Suillus spraguei]|nr:hypothetical protein BDR07DRAFT_837741 [Suillus spraguei]
MCHLNFCGYATGSLLSIAVILSMSSQYRNFSDSTNQCLLTSETVTIIAPWTTSNDIPDYQQDRTLDLRQSHARYTPDMRQRAVTHPATAVLRLLDWFRWILNTERSRDSLCPIRSGKSLRAKSCRNA